MPVPRFLTREEAHGAHLTLAAKGIKDHYGYVSLFVQRNITSLTQITEKEALELWESLRGTGPAYPDTSDEH